jgi:hypothetical protein
LADIAENNMIAGRIRAAGPGARDVIEYNGAAVYSR